MKLLLLVFISLLTFICLGQTAPKQLRFHHLFLKDGLVEAQVFQMEQDNDGYMWFGTRAGLVRFDGYTPKTYQFKTKVLPRTNVSVIYKDTKGNLWTSSAYEGLLYYDRPSDTFVHCKADRVNERILQTSVIDKILEDHEGNLWLTIQNKANSILDETKVYETIMMYNTKTHRFTNFSNIESGNHYVKYAKYLSPIIVAKDGNIWCGSDCGLYKYDKKRETFNAVFAVHDSFSHADFYRFTIDPVHADVIWFTDKGSLFRYNTSWKKILLKIDLHGEEINQLLFDANRQLWIAGTNGLSLFDTCTNKLVFYKSNAIRKFEDLSHGFWCITEKGLMYFDKETNQFSVYTYGEGSDELHGSPSTSFIDRSGIIWLSVAGEGVQWLNKRASAIKKYKIPKKKRVLQSPDSTYWVATAEGLYHWLPKTDSFTYIPIQKQETVGLECIMIDTKNNVWAGSSRKGVYCYNAITKKIMHYKYDKNDSTALSGARIGALLQDKKGNIWIGTWSGGVCRLDTTTKKIKRYPFIVNLSGTPNYNKLDDKDALSLYQDKEGTIWVGTNAGSMNRFDEEKQTFVSYQKHNKHFECIVNIAEDKEGRLWATTYAEGLFLVDKKKEIAKNISTKDGLLSNNSFGLLIDDYNNIWLNSARGISIYNPETGSVRTITNEMLQTNFNPYFALKTLQGLFMFPVNGGVAILNPNELQSDSTTPITHIETVIVNKTHAANKSIDSTIVRYGKNKIHLKYDENRIIFNYVGLIFQNVEQVKYKYKLDGYDNNWVYANTQRAATYTNLAPGTYTFHVTAANSDGIWDKKGDSIHITIAPPFWATWWFRAVIALLAAALIFLVARFLLTRKLKAQQQEFDRQKAIEKVRSKISMDIHDEISSGLTKISLLSQSIKSKYEVNKKVEPEIVDKITASSKEVIDNLGEIIWAVNPKHDNLQSLLSYIRNYITNFFEATTIECAVCFPEKISQRPVSPDMKHNLFLVIKEALNNIVKHAEATKVNIQFRYTENSYMLTIQDDGKGIHDLNGHFFGNGLTNMKTRMEAIGGHLTVHSACSKGTQLQLEGRFGAEMEA